MTHSETHAAPRGPQPASRTAPDWDLVLRRNNIERLKRDKFPLDILSEMEELGKRHYLDISEEDMVRFQWFGLYHDKPKMGTFMLRVKVPGGILTPAQYRVLGELAVQHGRNYTELSTRQTVQLHWLQVKQFPEVFAAMAAVGLTSLGACGDAVRNVTGCPVAGLEPTELFDCRQETRELVDFFIGGKDYFDLPRKHKISVSACAWQCNAPEINCIAFVGTRQPDSAGQGRLGYAVRVGGGLSATPRIARDLDVFVPAGQARELAQAILDEWRSDLRYRLSRAKARLKFLVDDDGTEALRARLESRLGRALERVAAPPRPVGATDHLGIHAQRQAGLYYIGVPIPLGQITGEQTIAVSDFVHTLGGDIRVTRQQNLILTGVPEDRVGAVTTALAALGLPHDADPLRGSSIACTGQPLCNFAVADTKPKLGEIITRLEGRYGRIEGLRLGVDGCPHACAHHWVSDIGLQGTTARGDGESGKREAYEIYLRGGLGEHAAIGKALLRRVPADEVASHVERLVGAYLHERADDETFQAFSRRKTDDELIDIATGAAATAP